MDFSLQVVERRSISVATPVYIGRRSVIEVVPARWRSVAADFAV